MKYRFYSFMNFYLSSLQQGLQSGHLISELFVKYQSDEVGYPTPTQNIQKQMLYDWASNDKVMIVCNGGNSKSIHELYNFFENENSISKNLPIVKFYEDDESLNNALTGCAIIVPELYYDARYDIDEEVYYSQQLDKNGKSIFKRYGYGSPEKYFIDKLKSFNLAK